MIEYFDVEPLFTLSDVSKAIAEAYCDENDTPSVVELEQILTDIDACGENALQINENVEKSPCLKSFLSDLYSGISNRRDKKKVCRVLAQLDVAYSQRLRNGSCSVYANYLNILESQAVEHLLAFPLPLKHILLNNTYKKFLSELDKSNSL